MRKYDDLDMIKEVARAFLYMDIEETQYSPVVILHPIFESAFYAIPEGRQYEIHNILEDEYALQKARHVAKGLIDRAKSAVDVYRIIRKSYKLTFIKYTKEYMCIKTFSELFEDAWVSSENPNQDENVPVPMLISWFREADKKYLMVEEDYEIFSQLPETITVYRGIMPGHNPDGLSWTENLSTANWFASRFNTDSDKGYIQKAVIDKSRALAYFNIRGEDELVVDTTGLQYEILNIDSVSEEE